VSATFTETSWFHDLSPFVSATFMICVHDLPRGKVLVKVGVMEFGLYAAGLAAVIEALSLPGIDRLPRPSTRTTAFSGRRLHYTFACSATAQN